MKHTCTGELHLTWSLALKVSPWGKHPGESGLFCVFFFFFLFRRLFLSFFLSLLPPLRPHTFEFTQWNPCVTCSHPSEYCRPTGWLRNTGLVLLTVLKSRSPRSGASKVPLPRRGRPTCPCLCITGGRQELRGVHVIEGLISSRGPILAASSPSQKPQLLTPSH